MADLEQSANGSRREPLLETVDLTKHFRIGNGLSRDVLHAADDVNLRVFKHEIVALVGESGSGKSTIARLLARVYRPTSGEILFEGRDLWRSASRKEDRALRGAMPMVFQDPYSSLNATYRVSHSIMRALKLHRTELDRKARVLEAERVLAAVGLVPAGQMLAKFPHEMSGGQRQRLGFAQALAQRPKLIIADEPVSMLDVSIRVGVLNLMIELRASQEVSLFYITHDIASARYVANRILVMYAGKIVEQGPTEQVLASPQHPYTKLLLDAVPDPRAELSLSDKSIGEPPRVIRPGSGCRFRPRCPYAMPVCDEVSPKLVEVAASGHAAACHLRTPVEIRTSTRESVERAPVT
jgi:oligopeptide/dipeptide ABC transporter ATP-binding protein